MTFASIFVVYGDLILRLWLGALIAPLFGYLGWLIVGATLVFASISTQLSELLIGLDDIWLQVKLVVISSIVVIFFMNLFVPYFDAPGVFLSMLLSTVIPIVVNQRRLRQLAQ